MFCSDDKHPDSLVEGHINQLVKRALAKGHRFVQGAAGGLPESGACITACRLGLLREGDPADFM
jgi:adenine deaminase